MSDRGGRPGEASRDPDEDGALLAELMVAAGLLLVGIMVVAATLGGPLRGLEQAALPSEGFEGFDRAALEFITAVRAARPSLTRPAVLTAEPDRLVLALDHLRSDTRGARTWSISIVHDALVVAESSDHGSSLPRIVLHDLDPERSSLRYFDAEFRQFDPSIVIAGGELARIRVIELRAVVVDRSGRAPDVEVVHRGALRVVGPLA
jgi:hypothetical protein